MCETVTPQLSDGIITADMVLAFFADFGEAKERPLLQTKAHGNFSAFV